jgi:hypothetical protein
MVKVKATKFKSSSRDLRALRKQKPHDKAFLLTDCYGYTKKLTAELTGVSVKSQSRAGKARLAHRDVERNGRPPLINMAEMTAFIAKVMDAKEKGHNVTLKEGVRTVCD